MKEKLLQYFKTIGIKQPLQERINEIYEFYTAICPEEIEDVFVSEYIKEEGTREYQTIRFFSKSYVMLANDFVQKDQYNISRYTRSEISAVRVEKKDYDFKKATDKSRMTISILWYGPARRSTYRASKENCDYLKAIFDKYIHPLVVYSEKSNIPE